MRCVPPGVPQGGYQATQSPLNNEEIRREDEASLAHTKALAAVGSRRENAQGLSPFGLEGPLFSIAFEAGIDFENLLSKPQRR